MGTVLGTLLVAALGTPSHEAPCQGAVTPPGQAGGHTSKAQVQPGPAAATHWGRRSGQSRHKGAADTAGPRFPRSKTSATQGRGGHGPRYPQPDGRMDGTPKGLGGGTGLQPPSLLGAAWAREPPRRLRGS